MTLQFLFHYSDEAVYQLCECAMKDPVVIKNVVMKVIVTINSIT